MEDCPLGCGPVPKGTMLDHLLADHLKDAPGVQITMLQALLSSAQERANLEYHLRIAAEADRDALETALHETRDEIQKIRDNFKRLLGEL